MNASPNHNRGRTATAEKSDDSRYLIYGRVAEQIHACLRDGRRPDVEALVADHPEMAEEIRQLVSAQVMLYELGHAPGDPGTGSGSAAARADVPGRLGDFRILGEIGRGGMGVVYEAQQISLNRRVALKVLPFAAVLDPKHLQRFKNEAQAAASLRHPNIVQVFSVGCERAVHFYAMDYIEGQTLAEVISQVSGVRGQESGDREARSDRIHAVPTSPDESGHYERSEQSTDSPLHPVTPSPSHPLTDTSPLAALSTEGSTRSPEFFRSVARLGIQAAEALEHAHGMGVVHRDIKPSNLMVDITLPSPSGRGAGGEGAVTQAPHLWITDFGLAMTQTDANLTMTGDLLGTLRYMSPEQVQAKHGVLDHRTDVYSLGLTLYELLTLQPAFPGDDRPRLIRQVIENDPRPPRQINQAIPRDLETIVQKATAKEPEGRYATAGQLAEDLRRFLEDKPVRAQRPTLLHKTAKWSRRHRLGVTTTVAVSFAVLLLALGLVWHGGQREARQRQRAEKNLSLALEAMDKVFFQLFDKGVRPFSSQPVAVERKLTPEGEELLQDAIKFYEQFAEANEGEQSLQHEVAKAYSRVGKIRGQLRDFDGAKESFSHALRIAKQLVSEFPDVAEYRECLVDIHIDRGLMLSRRFAHPARIAAAIPEFSEAIRIDPRSTEALNARGVAYMKQKAWKMAEADFSRVIELDPKADGPYSHRGWARGALGNVDGALADFAEAIRIDPSAHHAYYARGMLYYEKHDYKQAIKDHTEAIRICPSNGCYHGNRGNAHLASGQLEEAYRDFSETIRLTPRGEIAYANRAEVRRECGDFSGAIADYTKSIELGLDKAPLNSRGLAYLQTGNYEAALADLDKAIRKGRNYAYAYRSRGHVYELKGELDKALADLNKAIELKPDFSTAYYGRARIRATLGQMPSAVNDVKTAVQLSTSEPYQLVKLKSVAWFLTTCPDERLRNIKTALELASNARVHAPKDARVWVVLGAAQYRAGNWNDALRSLEKSAEFPSYRDGAGRLFLAMTHWQLGNEQRAHHWYHRAVGWAEEKGTTKDAVFRCLLGEAAELLEMDNE
jgi:serine/threonine protein kinase/Tfp pilus assembly protein PilF